MEIVSCPCFQKIPRIETVRGKRWSYTAEILCAMDYDASHHEMRERWWKDKPTRIVSVLEESDRREEKFASGECLLAAKGGVCTIRRKNKVGVKTEVRGRSVPVETVLKRPRRMC